MGELKDRKLGRRDVLKAGAFGAVAGTLAACTPGAVASPSGGGAAASGSASPIAVPSIVSGAKINLKLPHGSTEASPNHTTWVELAKAITARTNGQVTIDIFPNSTLGTDPETREQMAQGAPMIIGFAWGSGATIVPDLALFEGPFNFISHEQAVKTANSDLMNELADQLYKKAGWQIIARNFDNGARHILNKVRDVHAPADLVGLKFRVPQAPIYVDTFTALGATPVPLPLPEIYTGLQQGLVDGAEGFIAQHNDLKLTEVAKHLTLSAHIWQNAGMVGGKFFNALPQDIQTIFKEEAAKIGETHSARIADGVNKLLASMEAAGVTVVKEIDVAVWRAKAEAVYDKMRPTLTPGVIERFRAIRDA